jgi:hypothetical protein
MYHEGQENERVLLHVVVKRRVPIVGWRHQTSLIVVDPLDKLQPRTSHRHLSTKSASILNKIVHEIGFNFETDSLFELVRDCYSGISNTDMD